MAFRASQVLAAVAAAFPGWPPPLARNDFEMKITACLLGCFQNQDKTPPSSTLRSALSRRNGPTHGCDLELVGPSRRTCNSSESVQDCGSNPKDVGLPGFLAANGMDAGTRTCLMLEGLVRLSWVRPWAVPKNMTDHILVEYWGPGKRKRSRCNPALRFMSVRGGGQCSHCTTQSSRIRPIP